MQAQLSFSLRVWLATRHMVRAWGFIFYVAAAVWVLLLSPSTYTGASMQRVLRRIYLDTLPVLLGFTLLAALLCMVLTRIVVVTATSYGLSSYALEMVIRVLVLELIPLTSALFVAMRCTIPNGTDMLQLRTSGAWAQREQRGEDLLRQEVLPRILSGVFACITLAALSCVVGLVTAYLGVYGPSWAGLQGYTRMFGRIFDPSVTLLFTLKVWLSSWAVAVIPVATGMFTRHTAGAVLRGDELRGLARMFAVLLIIEMLSLIGNYY